jgi:hypothetical protein
MAAANRLNIRRNPHHVVCGGQRLPNNRDLRIHAPKKSGLATLIGNAS